jgi:hypothetical protein
MTMDREFGVELSSDQFGGRFLVIHKQLFASTEFAFVDVTIHVYTPPKKRKPARLITVFLRRATMALVSRNR